MAVHCLDYIHTNHYNCHVILGYANLSPIWILAIPCFYGLAFFLHCLVPRNLAIDCHGLSHAVTKRMHLWWCRLNLLLTVWKHGSLFQSFISRTTAFIKYSTPSVYHDTSSHLGILLTTFISIVPWKFTPFLYYPIIETCTYSNWAHPINGCSTLY